MTYVEIAPSAQLAPWVECFWKREASRSAATPVAALASGCESGDSVTALLDRRYAPVRVLPDGCADFVFDLSTGEAMAVGTMTKPLVIESGATNFVGVRFRPGRAAAFLRIPLAEITDARVTLRDVWREAPEEADIAMLERALLQRLAPDRDPRVDAAIEQIVRGAKRIDDIAKDIGISRQHLARQFQHHVGVSPKTFARVMRFRRLLEALPRNREVDWADLAVAHGYYDQSHLIDEFRELAGTTPASFRG